MCFVRDIAGAIFFRRYRRGFVSTKGVTRGEVRESGNRPRNFFKCSTNSNQYSRWTRSRCDRFVVKTSIFDGTGRFRECRSATSTRDARERRIARREFIGNVVSKAFGFFYPFPETGPTHRGARIVFGRRPSVWPALCGSGVDVFRSFAGKKSHVAPLHRK